MHTTAHVSIGIIIATLFSQFIELNFITFGLIVFFAFAPDFDIFLSHRAPDNNHRHLFTHSIWIPLIILLIAIIGNNLILLGISTAYFAHLFLDSLDWGLNAFYFKKSVFGPMILYKGASYDDLVIEINEYRLANEDVSGFFIKRYYSNRVILLLESFLLILMVVLIINLAKSYWYFLLLYGLFVIQNLHDYRKYF